MTFVSRLVRPTRPQPDRAAPSVSASDEDAPRGRPAIQPPSPLARHLVRKPKVLARTGMCNSSLHNAITAGTFPRPVSTGPRTVAWVESEVNDWIEARIAERDARLGKRAAHPVGHPQDARGASA